MEEERKGRGVFLLLHKYRNKQSITSEANSELFKDLDEVGKVFEQIHQISCVLSNSKTIEKDRLQDIEFLIMKSVADYINGKYNSAITIKYNDLIIQQRFDEAVSIPIEDLIDRCKNILKAYGQLSERQRLS